MYDREFWISSTVNRIAAVRVYVSFYRVSCNSEKKQRVRVILKNSESNGSRPRDSKLAVKRAKYAESSQSSFAYTKLSKRYRKGFCQGGELTNQHTYT